MFRFIFRFILSFCLMFLSANSLNGMFGYFFGEETKPKIEDKKRLPLVYHKDYNINNLGYTNKYGFDTQKYKKIYSYLVDTLKIDSECFYTPDYISDDDLSKTHSNEYLDSLNSSATIAEILEINLLKVVPHMWLTFYFLNPMKLITGGTMLAAQLALKDGWAINLAGGCPHAKEKAGGNLCIFNDIAVAIKKVQEENSDYKFLVVDLGAPQGNGTAHIFGDDKNVFTFDMYNEDLTQNNLEDRDYLNFNLGIKSGIQDEEYLERLKKKLPKAINQTKPNLIIYNAGTDIYKKDKYGLMKISTKGIIERDAFVFACALDSKIPIAMVLGGGYHEKSTEIIYRSIENILTNIVKVL